MGVSVLFVPYCLPGKNGFVFIVKNAKKKKKMVVIFIMNYKDLALNDYKWCDYKNIKLLPLISYLIVF